MEFDVLVRELESEDRDPDEFLSQGLVELEARIIECGGVIPHGSDFFEMDMRFSDILNFVSWRFPKVDIRAYEANYDKIMQQIYKKSDSPVLTAPYLQRSYLEDIQGD